MRLTCQVLKESVQIAINLPGAEGERPDSNPLGGRRETNLPGAEGERPDSNPLGINLPCFSDVIFNTRRLASHIL
ncbi:hypothetical protein HPA17_02280 [Streptococcus suis]|nr:hypothetical protein [Streptococcus suis]